MTRVAAALRWVGAPLCGQDGRPSFSKLIVITVLAMYAMAVSLPVAVAIAAIAASFGVRVFLAFLSRARVDVSALDARSSSVARQEVDVRVQLASDEDYDWEAGVDRRQL